MGRKRSPTSDELFGNRPLIQRSCSTSNPRLRGWPATSSQPRRRGQARLHEPRNSQGHLSHSRHRQPCPRASLVATNPTTGRLVFGDKGHPEPATGVPVRAMREMRWHSDAGARCPMPDGRCPRNAHGHTRPPTIADASDRWRWSPLTPVIADRCERQPRRGVHPRLLTTMSPLFLATKDFQKNRPAMQ